MASETLREKSGPVVLGLFVMVPGLIVSGFMSEWDVLPWWGWMLVSMAGGGVGAALMDEDHPIIGGVAGVVGGGTALVATVAYVMLRAELSDTFFSLEFVVPLLVGALPALAIRWVGVRLLGGPTAPPPPLHPSSELEPLEAGGEDLTLRE